jgi:flagellar biosynthesis component FlhA
MNDLHVNQPTFRALGAQIMLVLGVALALALLAVSTVAALVLFAVIGAVALLLYGVVAFSTKVSERVAEVGQRWSADETPGTVRQVMLPTGEPQLARVVSQSEGHQFVMTRHGYMLVDEEGRVVYHMQ